MTRTRIVATYHIGPDEVIQCSISIPTNYPDAINEAKTTILAMMRDQLADVIRQNHTAPDQP